MTSSASGAARTGSTRSRNGTDEPIRVLMLSTLIAPDIVEYPGLRQGRCRSVAGERVLLSRPGPILDYWDGEN